MPDPILNGGGGDGGGGAAGAGGAGGAGDGGGAATVVIPENWKEALPIEIRDDSSLKVIHDIPSLAKSFVNAQKMVGSDKVALPSKHSDANDWKQFFVKAGLPETLENYQVKAPEGSTFDETFIKDLKEVAYKNNILPNQLQELVNWHDGVARKAVKDGEDQVVDTRKATEDTLRKELGLAYDAKVQRANLALTHFGGKDLVEKSQSAGWANDADFVRMMVRVGDTMQEDKILGRGVFTGSKSPEEALAEINKIQSNAEHPYHNKNHANHKSAMDEVQALYGMAYPG